jgi:hypothetical protein
VAQNHVFDRVIAKNRCVDRQRWALC